MPELSSPPRCEGPPKPVGVGGLENPNDCLGPDERANKTFAWEDVWWGLVGQNCPLRPLRDGDGGGGGGLEGGGGGLEGGGGGLEGGGMLVCAPMIVWAPMREQKTPG